jgi:histidinol phosphatase-like enzyme
VKIQAVFLDRDGTIGGTGHFIHPINFELFPSAQESIDLLKKAGLKVFVEKYRDKWANVIPDYIAEDINDATTWILDRKLNEVRSFT